MSNSNSPCAACKCRRQKCTQECVYAPFFPADQPQRFINVHKVFGASNVAKLLNELPLSQREHAVNSLAYEAAYRLHDPVYGCVGLILFLQQRLKQFQFDLINARKELAGLINQQNPNNLSSAAAAIMPFNMQQMMGLPQVPVVAPPHGGQVIVVDSQQMVENQQLMFNYEQREQAVQMMGFNKGGFDGSTAVEYNQMVSTTSLSPIMGAYESASYDQLNQQQQTEHDTLHSNELQLRSQMLVHQQNSQQEHAKSKDARNVCP